MSKKQNRQRKLEEKRQKRDKKNWKKQKYDKMHEDGKLGNKETTSYNSMLKIIKATVSPDIWNYYSNGEGPNKTKYQELKVLYQREIRKGTLEGKFF